MLFGRLPGFLQLVTNAYQPDSYTALLVLDTFAATFTATLPLGLDVNLCCLFTCRWFLIPLQYWFRLTTFTTRAAARTHTPQVLLPFRAAANTTLV